MKVVGSPGSADATPGKVASSRRGADTTRASRDGQVPRNPGREAWWLILELFAGHKRRLAALSHEFDLAPMQLHALRLLEPGRELPMSALAESLHCDASNVTGIVDRLESRGLIERRDAPSDRRLRLLAITRDGERLRRRVVERMSEPPPPIAGLSEPKQRALRDILRTALDR